MTKLFPTESLAQLWVRRQLRDGRYNYFVGFRNAGPNKFGVSYGNADWAKSPYVKDVFPHIVH